MRRFVPLLLASAIALAPVGCAQSDDDSSERVEVDAGDDPTSTAEPTTSTSADEDDDGGELDEFCGIAEEINDFESGEEVEPELVVLYADLADAAPDDIEDDADTVGDLVDEIADLDPEDDDYLDELLELYTDDVYGAGLAVEHFVEEECDIEINPDGSLDWESEDGEHDDEPDTPTSATDDDGSASDGMSVEALMADLEDIYYESPWIEQITSQSITTTGSEATVVLGLEGPVSEADATEACSGVVSWVSQVGEVSLDDLEVTIEVDGLASAVFVNGDCQPT